MNYQIIVDKEHPIKMDYYNSLDLRKIINTKGESIVTEKETLENFVKLKNELLKRNIGIDIVSGLRMPEDNNSNDLSDMGNSEYYTGLVIDIEVTDSDSDIVNMIVTELMSEYGFILRKKERNVYTLRYVTNEVAKKINSLNITLEEYVKWMNFELLDYNKYHERIKKIITNENVKNKVKVHESIAKTTFGFDIEHYSVGNGKHHIVVVGGTHGTEIISVDFVTKLMEEVSLGNTDIDLDYFTLDFFPLHNPEGFVITTSAVNTLISDKLNGKEKEKICKDYYLAFKNDDINAVKGIEQDKLKLHQEMFKDATWECIPEKFSGLRENIRRIYETGNFPKGSLIDWRSNGSGVELNANTPDNDRFERIQNGEVMYGALRYNNICGSLPGPLGVPSIDPINFKFEPENISLFNYIANLHNKGEYYGMFTYHGTAGAIVHKPYDFSDFDHILLEKGELKKRNYSEAINDMVAKTYADKTTYKTSGLKLVDVASLEGCGDMLRSLYPGVILVELSKMGGNPIAPYGDIFGNYRNVIRDNISAFSESLKTIRSLDKLMYNHYYEDLREKYRR